MSTEEFSAGLEVSGTDQLQQGRRAWTPLGSEWPEGLRDGRPRALTSLDGPAPAFNTLLPALVPLGGVSQQLGLGFLLPGGGPARAADQAVAARLAVQGSRLRAGAMMPTSSASRVWP